MKWLVSMSTPWTRPFTPSFMTQWSWPPPRRQHKFPSVHPLAVGVVFVGNEHRRLVIEQAQLVGKKVIGRIDRGGAQPGRGEIDAVAGEVRQIDDGIHDVLWRGQAEAGTIESPPGGGHLTFHTSNQGARTHLVRSQMRIDASLMKAR